MIYIDISYDDYGPVIRTGNRRKTKWWAGKYEWRAMPLRLYEINKLISDELPKAKIEIRKFSYGHIIWT